MDRIQRSVALALSRRSDVDFTVWAESLERGLGDTQAAENWRTMMSLDLSFFRSKTSQWLREMGREEGRAEGRVQERAHGIVAIMTAREVPLTADEVERVQSCTDEALLDRWFGRAVSAESAAELFAEG